MKKHVTLFSSVLMMSTTLLGAGGVFATTSVDETNPNPGSASTPVTTRLTINETPTTPTPPKGEEGGADEGTGISGTYGIAYVPGQLSGQAELQESGEQQVDLAKDNKVKYNVGVQDKTRKNDQKWVLKAKLAWTEDTNSYMKGTKITATNGTVMENKEGVLSGLTDSQVTTSASNLTIEQESEVEVMKANSGKTMNGVYNYQFQSPKLIIPNPEKVAAGSYSGTINWNLVNAPEL
ncbi:WxL domain-containing protein [Enterococcus faecium]|nr:WxL domain-containing protein [Enterococcus faecium]MDQ8341201.1 WxL domain-containing protein [Enterococcus faecium]MDQ8348419.1 WxL domain-containing protein [Enterococcus faecium]MDQ8525969.1 WxL domain-containing protein [Enterococcus faecium]